MNVYVFKTDISSASLMNIVMPFFNEHPYVSQWSVDTEDVDNVLRVVSDKKIENEIIEMVKTKGFICKPLPD